MEDVNLVLVTTLLRIFHKKIANFPHKKLRIFFLHNEYIPEVPEVDDSFPEGCFPRRKKSTLGTCLLGKCLLGNYTSGKASLWETVLLGNWPPGKNPSGKITLWETVLLGNFLLGKNPLGKILWEFTSGKLPNTTTGSPSSQKTDALTPTSLQQQS